jgi:hypothetical protein
VILLLILNAVSTPLGGKKTPWLTVLFAGSLLLFFFACSWAASPARLGLPVPLDWPPAPGPLRGAAMYAQVIAAMEMMNAVAEGWIAVGLLTTALFAVLFWRILKLAR